MKPRFYVKLVGTLSLTAIRNRVRDRRGVRRFTRLAERTRRLQHRNQLVGGMLVVEVQRGEALGPLLLITQAVFERDAGWQAVGQWAQTILSILNEQRGVVGSHVA